ncbi:MAG: type III-B CRISPR-associated protein Cas10/Cmr2 [Leptolyngbyaceae cyanobacterium bins.59]|nr:type III-B CRISPR-associated protein Cas10/Cmr2 [Leptolyngbyaceae cyanobacterium bins.59]
MTHSTATVYTAITFAPVQGFIEKSRKLRDLYGSSFILSYLSRALCDTAQDLLHDADNNPEPVISPALINLTQGTPNQIIICGNFPENAVRAAFAKAWTDVVEVCREEIEKRLLEFQPYRWQRAWNAWSNHTWELFWAQTHEQDYSLSDRIGEVRRRLNEQKRSRAWTGINWTGESSTLSGADAIAWYGMADKTDPKHPQLSQQTAQIREFYQHLSAAFTESIVAPNERLSIPELIKRLITLDAIADRLNLKLNERPSVEIPLSFKDINRHRDKPDERRWTGWFQGDGDRIGEYLKHSVETNHKSEAEVLHDFSQAMIDWGGKTLKFRLLEKSGRIIYAGGDDFLGVLYRNAPEPNLSARECLNWLYTFPGIWNVHQQKITVSVGFVWTAPGVPQRDVLQHCRETEQAAKQGGRDRIAIRILFNGGNYLQWICPWKFLPMLQDYQDRNHKTGLEANWTHLYQDIAALESRHAFANQTEVARALFAVYFGTKHRTDLDNDAQLWNSPGHSGILGDRTLYPTLQMQQRALNDWVINLAKVGFHLHDQ